MKNKKENKDSLRGKCRKEQKKVWRDDYGGSKNTVSVAAKGEKCLQKREIM